MPQTAEERRARARDLRLRRTYGITSEDYEQLLAAQAGKCAICALPPRGKLPLNVDHDHKTGLVRGLLCWSCNHRVLPSARDNAATLSSAAKYLRHPPAVKVIGRVIAPILKPKRRRRKSSRSTPKS